MYVFRYALHNCYWCYSPFFVWAIVYYFRFAVTMTTTTDRLPPPLWLVLVRMPVGKHAMMSWLYYCVFGVVALGWDPTEDCCVSTPTSRWYRRWWWKWDFLTVREIGVKKPWHQFLAWVSFGFWKHKPMVRNTFMNFWARHFQIQTSKISSNNNDVRHK